MFFQGTERQMMGLWQELYRTFARLAAMVPNADVNVWVEEFCAKMWAVLPLDSTVVSLRRKLSGGDRMLEND